MGHLASVNFYRFNGASGPIMAIKANSAFEKAIVRQKCATLLSTLDEDKSITFTSGSQSFSGWGGQASNRATKLMVDGVDIRPYKVTLVITTVGTISRGYEGPSGTTTASVVDIVQGLNAFPVNTVLGA
jgi:hypothetical protein